MSLTERSKYCKYYIFQICENYSHEGSDSCIKHCDEKNHGHCIFFYCENSPHKESNFCEKHCKEQNHGHCVYMDAKIRILKEEMNVHGIYDLKAK